MKTLITLSLILTGTLFYSVFAQSGNVGIGTDSPSAKLHVNGGNIKIVHNARPWLIFQHPTDSINGGLRWSEDSVAQMEVFYNPIWQDLRFVDANVDVPRVVFRRTGAVGIGTEFPEHILDVKTVLNADGVAAVNGRHGFSGLPIKTYGVRGEIWNGLTTGAAGVFGLHNSATGSNTGVLGRSISPDGKGVHGDVTDATGVNYAVYGSTASTEGFAGYFEGGKNYFGGSVGIGVDAPGSMLHLFTSSDGSRGISIDAQGVLPGQQAYLELITEGDGTSKLGQPGNKGWHITGRGAAYGGVSQQNDLLISNWDGSSWSETMFFDAGGNIGIGTNSPGHKLEIISAGDYAGSRGLSVTNEYNPGAPTVTFGILGKTFNSSNTAFTSGVFGIHDATSGAGAGVIGQSHSTNGKGVFGHVDHATGSNIAVYGLTESTNGFAGYFEGGKNYFEGNVGIGVTDPQSLLHIVNGIGSGDPTNAHVDAFIEDDYAYLEFSGNQFGGITFKDDGASIDAGVIYDYGDDRLEFRVGNTDYLFLDDLGRLGLIAGGKFGIGTTPDWPLHVTSNSQLRAGYFFNTFTSSQTTFGLYSGAYGTGSGNKRGGSFDANGGTGQNIGVRAVATDGSSNIAIYGTASGGTTNWAAHFDDGYVIVDERLGVGTASPSYLVHATTSSLNRTGYFFNEMNSSSNKYGIYAGAYGTGSGSNRGGVFEANNGTGSNYGVRGLALNGTTNTGVYGNASGGTTNWAGYFNDGDVYIKNDLGIGTTSPGQRLHISGGDMEINDGFPWIYLDATTSTGNSGIYFQNQDFTRASIFYNKNSDYLQLENETSGDYIAIDNSGIGINTVAPDFQLHYIGNSSGDIAEFYNSSTGTNADVLRTKVNSLTPGTGQYYLRCVDGGSGTDGGVRADGTGGVFFGASSDRRLKANIHDFEGALSILEGIRPRTYEYKQAPGKAQIGFIAQELKTAYPMAVAGDEKSDVDIEPMMIDYSKLTPLLVGATQELHEIIQSQQEEIHALKKQLEEIKKLLLKNE